MKHRSKIITFVLLLTILFLPNSSSLEILTEPREGVIINFPTDSYIEVFNVTENGYTISLPVLNQWYNFTGLQPGESQNFILSSNGIVVVKEGIYKIDYSVSFGGTGGSTHAIGTAINNIEHTPCTIFRKLGTAGDVGNAGGTCIFTAYKGDVISGIIKDINAPSTDVTIWSMNANIERIGDLP